MNITLLSYFVLIILESSCISPSCRHLCPATPLIATLGETSCTSQMSLKGPIVRFCWCVVIFEPWVFSCGNRWYPKNPYMKEYIYFPPTFSSTSFVNGVGNGSCKHESFNFLISTQIQSPLVFFPCTTIFLIHSDYSTGSIILVANILSILTFTFSLYFGFNL
jgi:hypothetical protein